MHRLFRLSRNTIATVAILAFSVASQAQIVTVNFTGTVTALPDPTGLFAGAAVGDTITGSLVYNTTAVAFNPAANPAQYLYTPASTPPFASPLGITFTLHGVTLTPRYPGAMIVTVQNDLASNPTFPDVFIAQAAMTSPGASVSNPQMDFALADRNGTALSSTALPSSLNVPGFTDSQFRVFNNSAGNVFDIVTGTINLAPAASVPEPGVNALLGGLLIPGVSLVLRRRRA